MSRRKTNANRDTATDANVEPNIGNAPVAANGVAALPTPCRVHVHHVRNRLADPDGLSIKAVLDGVVAAGVLPTDTAQSVSEVTHSQAKGKSEMTIVTIEPDPAA
jgi:hypothetical protein